MRYWAKLMLTGVPVMVTWRSLVPSSWLPILIWAPDTCLISLILVPWRPMIEPISCTGAGAGQRSLLKNWSWWRYIEQPSCHIGFNIRNSVFLLCACCQWGWFRHEGQTARTVEQLQRRALHILHLHCLHLVGHPSCASKALFPP